MKLTDLTLPWLNHEQLKYQEELANIGHQILLEKKIAYLAVEMRVGKTLTAFRIAELQNANKVLFVTTNSALPDVLKMYEMTGFTFSLEAINYEKLLNPIESIKKALKKTKAIFNKIRRESKETDIELEATFEQKILELEKKQRNAKTCQYLERIYDIVIVDESHNIGAYPQMTQRAIGVKQIVHNNKCPLLLSSGTPTPENFAQLFHQFNASPDSPFDYRNFYEWYRDFGTGKKIRGRGGVEVVDYGDVIKEKIYPIIDAYTISFTREKAGFQHSEVTERIIKLPLSNNVAKMIKILTKEKYYQFNDGSEIMADTAVKLQSKIHQACSGTILTDDGIAKIIDISKAKYIREHYSGQKIAIFYKYTAEGDLLRKIIPNSTDDAIIFKNIPDTTFVRQIVSGSTGVDLSSAKVLIFYNVDFSAAQYWQSVARLLHYNRTDIPYVDFLCLEGGIEEKILKVVKSKKKYTTYYFKKDFGYAG